MIDEKIASLRKEYSLYELTENSVDKNPFVQFSKWWQHASDIKIEEINAMTLATADTEGNVNARIVLLKTFDESGFVFFTNYNSNKSTELTKNPKCSLLLYWKELERQIKINGVAEKISTKESIAYFNSRPEGSKLGAWASPQSMVVAGKEWLTETFNFYRERFKHGEIPKPPHWGGYRVVATSIEFWQGRPSRMHDRILYSKQDGNWKIERLAP